MLTPVDLDAVRAAGRFFAAEGVASVAICFLNSYANPANERAAAAALADGLPRRSPSPPRSTCCPRPASTSAPRPPRSTPTCCRRSRGYLARLEERLRARGVTAPLLIGNSNGGLARRGGGAREAGLLHLVRPRRRARSAPSGWAQAIGEADLVAFDMGGTTASAALIHRGVLARTHEYEFRAGLSVPARFIKAGGYMMRVPTVDVAEVGNGAGSIAAIDAAGLLTVGPAVGRRRSRGRSATGRAAPRPP